MTALALQPGSELDRGKYRIVRLVGQGGMGSVYEAEHTLTRKRVAIKWMHPAVAAASGSARLVREAQAAARVRHRNAVDVYDVGEDGDSVFLVMEYLEGERLSSLLAREGVPMHRVIAMLLPAMRAVAAAHRQGVVHRDIKPDNIFLAREEDSDDLVPKVLDFGISKVEPRDLPHASITREGSAIGTPRYMSFEQLSGERDLDGRADVYAFGVILYEALTGRAPFEATSFSELVVKVATQEPPAPKLLRAQIPGALAKLVMWALAREREARLPSIEAFVRELEPFATAHGFRAEMTSDDLPLVALPTDLAESEVRKVTAGPPTPRAAATLPRRNRGRWWIGGALALLVLLLGGGAMLRGVPSARFGTTVPDARGATSTIAATPPPIPAPTPPIDEPPLAAPSSPGDAGASHEGAPTRRSVPLGAGNPRKGLLWKRKAAVGGADAAIAASATPPTDPAAPAPRLTSAPSPPNDPPDTASTDAEIGASRPGERVRIPQRNEF